MYAVTVVPVIMIPGALAEFLFTVPAACGTGVAVALADELAEEVGVALADALADALGEGVGVAVATGIGPSALPIKRMVRVVSPRAPLVSVALIGSSAVARPSPVGVNVTTNSTALALPVAKEIGPVGAGESVKLAALVPEIGPTVTTRRFVPRPSFSMVSVLVRSPG